MDYTNVCQGWIYCITNKVNGKKYIGKTNDLKRRMYEHLPKFEKCPILMSAYNKYGIENFNSKVLVHFTAINNDVLNSILNWLESFYISKYDTYRNGYNATYGGEGICGHAMSEETKKKISSSKKGNVVSDYCKKKVSEAWHKNKMWKFAERPILKYDHAGRFVKRYNTIKEAAAEIMQHEGDSRKVQSIRTSISDVLNGRRRDFCDSFWRYDEPDNFQLFIDVPANKYKPVYYYSKEGILISSYLNTREASETTGIAKDSIKASCLRKGEKRTNYWSYNPPT